MDADTLLAEAAQACADRSELGGEDDPYAVACRSTSREALDGALDALRDADDPRYLPLILARYAMGRQDTDAWRLGASGEPAVWEVVDGGPDALGVPIWAADPDPEGPGSRRFAQADPWPVAHWCSQHRDPRGVPAVHALLAEDRRALAAAFVVGVGDRAATEELLRDPDTKVRATVASNLGRDERFADLWEQVALDTTDLERASASLVVVGTWADPDLVSRARLALARAQWSAGGGEAAVALLSTGDASDRRQVERAARDPWDARAADARLALEDASHPPAPFVRPPPRPLPSLDELVGGVPSPFLVASPYARAILLERESTAPPAERPELRRALVEGHWWPLRPPDRVLDWASQRRDATAVALLVDAGRMEEVPQAPLHAVRVPTEPRWDGPLDAYDLRCDGADTAPDEVRGRLLSRWLLAEPPSLACVRELLQQPLPGVEAELADRVEALVDAHTLPPGSLAMVAPDRVVARAQATTVLPATPLADALLALHGDPVDARLAELLAYADDPDPAVRLWVRGLAEELRGRGGSVAEGARDAIDAALALRALPGAPWDARPRPTVRWTSEGDPADLPVVEAEVAKPVLGGISSAVDQRGGSSSGRAALVVWQSGVVAVTDAEHPAEPPFVVVADLFGPPDQPWVTLEVPAYIPFMGCGNGPRHLVPPALTDTRLLVAGSGPDGQGVIRWWDTRSRRLLGTWLTGGNVRALGIDRRGRPVALIGQHLVRLTPRPRFLADRVEDLAVEPDGTAVARLPGGVTPLDLATGRAGVPADGPWPGE
ncbi:MAG: hypothetical protein H6735_32695 [Alphaproteobacteria bacterium]|nr:hypothetical protein [Alphaproteobacteria bacterium]